MPIATESHSRPWTGLEADRRAPSIIRCDHAGGQMCRSCLEQFAAVLSDVPALLDDLDVSIIRDVRFVQHGHRTPRQTTDADDPGHAFAEAEKRERRQRESGLPYDDRASDAKEQVLRWLSKVGKVAGVTGQPADVVDAVRGALGRLAMHPDLPAIAGGLSHAVSRAHKAIDLPPTPWYYGPCPLCGHDIHAERIYDETHDARVTCPRRDCTYSAHPVDHRLAQIEAGANRMLTVGELVGAITAAGEVVTRDQIKGWIRRDGLAREQRSLTQWVDGQIVSRSVWVYRLGDVRELAQASGDRRALRPSVEAIS